ncbi:MAG TPA: DPP IV N-terminal domain-containing protein, partial [Vicinamibacterales bacterium]|nr:DPP IV N-terminal domain-containing protein [Vicinamibacterales bacterium]
MRTMMPFAIRGSLIALAFAPVIAPLAAQSPRASVTAADYARAERFLAPAVTNLVVGGSVAPTWLADDRFWYRSALANGRAETILVDPIRKTRTVCTATAGAVDGCPSVDAAAAPQAGRGRQGGQGGRGNTPTSSDGKTLALSPDRSKGAFVRDWNLWVRDVATGREHALTADGSKYFGYATDNAGWSSSDRAILLWSPDSKKIATQQQDEREVGEMYLVNTTVGHPTLRVSKFPLPGDPVMAMVHRVVIDVDRGRVTRLQMPPDFHRATLGDDLSMNDYNWSPDGSQLALASVSRDHKHVVLRVADTSTGKVRDVLEETVATQFESRGWRVLWRSNEVVWHSERDNWGNLYLHDLQTGRLKKQITKGESPVMQIARVDEANRAVWYGANGRPSTPPGAGSSQDPYFLHFFRVGLDDGATVALTPAEGTHAIQVSPSGRYVIDTYSKPDAPPVVELRDANGSLVLPLEKADISRLLATGWQPPMPITMTAHDGKTDIYGLLFRPTNFDPAKKYPIVNNVYPGPQTGSTGSRAFNAARGDRQALAELGFIVVTIDGMGTPGRSKAFQDAYYGAMGRDNTIPDQIAGMTELASRYPWIDLDRAGIWGHSGGGFATTTAMFRFPDFFKVGIAESGNHDQRENEDDWGERYQGLVTKNPDGTDSYDAEANQNFAKNLKGHLLLAHGTMDTNVPPYQTMLIADALIKANKDFDLLMIPNANHGYGAASNYMMRRRWDYFVKWLKDFEPPREYEIGAAPAPRLRGVSGVSSSVAWASGANGTILRTIDGGRTWEPRPVPETQRLDFRDIDAFSDRVAYVMSIGSGESSRIYKTADGGAHWDLQFANTDPRVFLDAMTFADETHGFAFSDSVDGAFVILTTSDGRAWTRIPADRLPPALPGEGAFAASGSNVAMLGRDHIWIGTTASRVLHSVDGGRSWMVTKTPMATGTATGIFSIAFRDRDHGIVVGGNYQKETDAIDNAAITSDGGATWTLVKGLAGFRSAVAWLPGSAQSLVAVGPSGIDRSSDG